MTRRRVLVGALLALALLYVPECDGDPNPAEGEPFVWDQASVWATLQTRFDRARARGCHSASIEIAERIQSLGARVRALPEDLAPDAIASGF